MAIRLSRIERELGELIERSESRPAAPVDAERAGSTLR
jgi:hypothetical protein